MADRWSGRKRIAFVLVMPAQHGAAWQKRRAFVGRWHVAKLSLAKKHKAQTKTGPSSCTRGFRVRERAETHTYTHKRGTLRGSPPFAGNHSKTENREAFMRSYSGKSGHVSARHCYEWGHRLKKPGVRKRIAVYLHLWIVRGNYPIVWKIRKPTRCPDSHPSITELIISSYEISWNTLSQSDKNPNISPNDQLFPEGRIQV